MANRWFRLHKWLQSGKPVYATNPIGGYCACFSLDVVSAVRAALAAGSVAFGQVYHITQRYARVCVRRLSHSIGCKSETSLSQTARLPHYQTSLKQWLPEQRRELELAGLIATFALCSLLPPCTVPVMIVVVVVVVCICACTPGLDLQVS